MSRKRKKRHLKDHRRATSGEPARRVMELMALGWSQQDADHLCVIEVALTCVADLSPKGRCVMAAHVSTAIAWQPVRLAVPSLYGIAEHAEAWRALSAAADPPYNRFMAELAAVDCDIVPADEMTAELLNPDNVHHLDDALRAEARGDFAAAISSLGQALRPVQDTWRTELEFMLRQADVVSPATWGRWMCGAALRWGTHTDHGLESGILLAEVVLRALGAPEEGLPDWVPTRLVWDQLIHDAQLFDGGLLDYWLNHEAGPALLHRAPGIGAWVLAQPTVVELAMPVDSGVLLRDLRTGQDVVLGDEVLGEEHPSGRCFYGRLVQIDGDDRWWFATIPTVMDSVEQIDEVLQALEDGASAEERLRAIYARVDRAGLP